tara:strand:- start:251 stop:493 length:243 start_codon:yes stop_codon:yes gene_type:complete
MVFTFMLAGGAPPFSPFVDVVRTIGETRRDGLAFVYWISSIALDEAPVSHHVQHPLRAVCVFAPEVLGGVVEVVLQAQPA